MLNQYIIFAISIVFISFVVGMVMTALVKETDFYRNKLSNLNFLENEFANKIIGVGLIKWIVKNTFFKFLNPNLKFERKVTISEILNIRNNMTKSEIDHLFAFMFVSIFIIREMINNNYILALVILVANILMNLHPSLLQQQNKRRIDRLLTRIEKS